MVLRMIAALVLASMAIAGLIRACSEPPVPARHHLEIPAP